MPGLQGFRLDREKGEVKVRSYEKVGQEIGQLVQDKNRAHGDAFGKTAAMLEVLYPEGIKPEQYKDLGLITRIFDKLGRIANDAGAFDESPYRDIAGYGILGEVMHQRDDKQESGELKYKVGDKVRIVSEWPKDGEYSDREGKIDKWLGKAMTIREAWKLGNFYLYKMQEDLGEFGGLGWNWYSCMIEGLAEQEGERD